MHFKFLAVDTFKQRCQPQPLLYNSYTYLGLRSMKCIYNIPIQIELLVMESGILVLLSS